LYNSNLCEIHDPDIGIQHSIHFALENLVTECLFGVLISYELVINVGNEFEKKTPTSKKLISSLECDESESDSFKNRFCMFSRAFEIILFPIWGIN
jgi:hypothetical protein